MIRIRLGSAILREKHHAESIEHLERCLAMDENYAAVFNLLGRTQFKVEQRDTDKQAFTKGLEKTSVTCGKQTARELQVFKEISPRLNHHRTTRLLRKTA